MGFDLVKFLIRQGLGSDRAQARVARSDPLDPRSDRALWRVRVGQPESSTSRWLPNTCMGVQLLGRRVPMFAKVYLTLPDLLDGCMEVQLLPAGSPCCWPHEPHKVAAKYKHGGATPADGLMGLTGHIAIGKVA